MTEPGLDSEGLEKLQDVEDDRADITDQLSWLRKIHPGARCGLSCARNNAG